MPRPPKFRGTLSDDGASSQAGDIPPTSAKTTAQILRATQALMEQVTIRQETVRGETVRIETLQRSDGGALPPQEAGVGSDGSAGGLQALTES